MALHPHRPVRREQDRTRGIALAGGQAGRVHPGLNGSFRRQAASSVQPGAHAGDDVALGIARPVGDEGQVGPPRRRVDQVPVAP